MARLYTNQRPINRVASLGTGSFSTTSTVLVPITGTDCIITTRGRPVVASLQTLSGAFPQIYRAFIGFPAATRSSDTGFQVYLYRNPFPLTDTAAYGYLLQSDCVNSGGAPVNIFDAFGSLAFSDTPNAGTWLYQIQTRYQGTVYGTPSVGFIGLQLVVEELI